MTQAHPIISTHSVETYVAAAWRVLGWLLSAILHLHLTGRSARLRHLLAHSERAVECVLFVKALALYGPLPQRSRHRRAAPPGFRRVVRHAGTFFGSAKIRARKANALARVLALVDALARPERAVAYFLKHIRKGLRLSSLIAIAPPAHLLVRALMAVEGDFSDSS